MKRNTWLVVLVIASCFELQAQNSEGNPFARLGYKVDVYTFGEKKEFHDQQEIVKIGDVLFNTKTNEVVGFVEDAADSLMELKPELQSMSIDPHCEKYYSTTPYAYCLNNPVKYIDPTGLAPIYDPDGNFLGTDDKGLQGQAIIMESSNFSQGMRYNDALKYSLGADILKEENVISKFLSHYNGLKDRPDYDGFVSIDEGIAWAKNHPDALDKPTADNSLYVNTALLDFGDISTKDFKELNAATPVNLFSTDNSIESLYNATLRSTVYALGRVDLILYNRYIRTVSVVNNSATGYDWNAGGGIIRNSAIKMERKRAGLNSSHGFNVYYYGVGRLRK